MRLASMEPVSLLKQKLGKRNWLSSSLLTPQSIGRGITSYAMNQGFRPMAGMGFNPLGMRFR